jgi:hypothetical protein
MYQAKNSVADPGLTSMMKPWPDVAASNQLPPSAESLFVGRAFVVEQVALCVRRVSGIEPLRSEPSVNV